MVGVLGATLAYTQLGPGGALSDIRAGLPAPDFELTARDGSTVRLSDYRGRPVLVNFWATFCPRCVEELPLIADAESRHADAGLAVVAVNAGQTREHVVRYLDHYGIDVPVVFDPGKIVYRAYRIVGLPTTVWVDADGVVRATDLGVLTPELVERRVRELAERRATPPSDE